MSLAVFGAPEGFDALLLRARRVESQAPVLHVCRDDARMARLAVGDQMLVRIPSAFLAQAGRRGVAGLASHCSPRAEGVNIPWR